MRDTKNEGRNVNLEGVKFEGEELAALTEKES